MPTVVVAAVTVGGVGALAATAEAAASSDNGALYAAVSAVLVAMIGGTVAIITSGRRQTGETPAARYVDEPTSHALTQSLTDLLEDALAREKQARDAAERAVRRAELWEGRARKLGWDRQ